MSNDNWHGISQTIKTLPNLRSAKAVTLICVVVLEGAGKSPEDPFREVTYYYDMDGNLVAKQDPCKENHQ